MKKLLYLVFAASLFFAGCSSKPDDSTTKFVTSDVKEWKQVPTGKLNQFGNPEMTTEYFYAEKAVIQPTFGQSFSWAFKSGYTIWFIVSLVLVGVTILLIVKQSQDKALKIGKASIDPGANEKKGGQNLNLMCFVLLVGALASFGTQPGSIRWNNKKAIDKAHYEQVVKENGDSKPIWDSLWNENRITWAGHK